MPPLADAGFTVITPDLRGLGNSCKAGDEHETTGVAEDVRQIAQSVGLDTITLVGTDIGTRPCCTDRRRGVPEAGCGGSGPLPLS